MARWLTRHIRAQNRKRTPVKNWQWGPTIACWMIEEADVQAPGRAIARDNIQIELGVRASALRQKPFTAWDKGEKAMRPGVDMPGMRCNAANRFGMTNFELSEQACQHLREAITALAEDTPMEPPPEDHTTPPKERDSNGNVKG